MNYTARPAHSLKQDHVDENAPMPAAPSSPHAIPFEPQQVQGIHEPVTAVIDLDSPRQGIACGGDRLLGLDLKSRCVASDHWIRGGDVVAVYEPDDPRHLRATALWRHRATPGIATWELIASATTSRRESDASLAVVSNVATTEVLWGCSGSEGLRWENADSPSAACILIRRPETHSGSVFLAVHPADSRGLLVRRDSDRTTVECWLFSAAAEKGVLFRGRALAALGPRAEDTSWAERLWAEFVGSPAMLTT